MTQMMKALVKREAGKGIWMEEVPVPTPGPNEVLIKLEKTAICGTDLHIYLWDEWSQRTIKPGLVIGHEFVGRVHAIGMHALSNRRRGFVYDHVRFEDVAHDRVVMACGVTDGAFVRELGEPAHRQDDVEIVLTESWIDVQVVEANVRLG